MKLQFNRHNATFAGATLAILFGVAGGFALRPACDAAEYSAAPRLELGRAADATTQAAALTWTDGQPEQTQQVAALSPASFMPAPAAPAMADQPAPAPSPTIDAPSASEDEQPAAPPSTAIETDRGPVPGDDTVNAPASQDPPS